MPKFQIEAKHPSYDVVVFILEAEDDKKAFSVWRQVVGNNRQWIVRSNTEVKA